MSNPTKRFKSAIQLFDHLGIECEIPIDIELVADKLGIKVENKEPTEEFKEIVGEIFFYEDSPIIRVNPKKNSYLPRRRFTIAHEIGHYCLHSAESKQGFKDSQKAMSRTESYWDRLESEANNFAAQILMPAKQVYGIGKKVIATYKELTKAEKIPTGVFTETMADRFQVSNKAMEYRLKNLRIIRN
uniref:IrrE N-terminal-like domain-containing protein n=1 Tax=Candidatus Kentrum sp. FM TaxID=2126340 RepID=A0A450S7K3_9GAMM|nr:MAG: protein of unknown function (DUF955) [Candidatus Kentron sp. FM]VFJ47890.1 MAG: protein of unknown function (DUF955) [Candidatus Kentron sp. FM]VFK07828.1 MAG: protein of unknown function (DUF955) [Candidatus Kentron sp. FM]